MIRYQYVKSLNPPAPFVNISLRCPATGTQLTNLPAQLDSAADRTILPGSLVRTLGLVEDGRQLFEGFAGEIVELPIYLVEIRVHDLLPTLHRAALGEREPHTLLGRDVLNLHRFLLDGPQLTLEIG